MWKSIGPVVLVSVPLACAVDDRSVGLLPVTAEAGSSGALGVNAAGSGDTDDGGPTRPAPEGTGAAGRGDEGLGGSGPVGGAAGTNGEPAAGGTNGEDPVDTGAIPLGPPGTGFAITPLNGWVSGATNEVGIQGAFYTLSDARSSPAGTTTIEPADFGAAGGAICISGATSQVLDDEYGRYWGGGVALSLGDPGGGMPLQPLDRSKVFGFSYILRGPVIPASLTIGVTLLGSDTSVACAPLTATSGTRITTMLSSLVASCWEAGGAQLPPTTPLRSLEWLIATNTNAPTPFDFCIEELTAIGEP